MVNFWRTTLSCILGTFLAVDGLDFRQWCNGDDCGRERHCAIRLPNPRMVAIGFYLRDTGNALDWGCSTLVIVLIPNKEHIAAVY